MPAIYTVIMSVTLCPTNAELLHQLRENVKVDRQGNPTYSYTDILIANDLTDGPEVRVGLESLIAIYDKLYGFGLSLSGYQFIGLLFERSFLQSESNPIYPFAYFMLAIGFIVSLFGALLSFCMYEFLVVSRSESNEYITKGVIKYRYYLKLPHDVLLVNTFLFSCPINILIHHNLSTSYGIIFNAASVVLLGIGFPIHRKMIALKQTHALAKIDRGGQII